jgi:hypothetical protein
METPGSAQACPRCGSNARVAKVSRLYLEATDWRADPRPEPPASLLAVLDEKTLAALAPGSLGRSRFLHDLARRLAPPSAASRTGRMIHPDMLVLAFAAIGSYLLQRVAADQPGLLAPAGLLLAGAAAAYLALRGRVLARFESRREDDRLAAERVGRAVKRWLELYYCGADGAVFDPQGGWIHESGGLAAALLAHEPERPAAGGSKIG